MEPFGRYVLMERIAAGGMAEVFRAAAVGSAGFSKTVAIKRVLPHLTGDPSFVSMLIDEAKIASTLIHPNILQVLDLGQHNGTYFIAMEFVVGKSLEQVVNRAKQRGEKLPQDFCVFVMKEALQGLAYAHQKKDSFGNPAGLIHRDVSPANIMLGYDGGVKLTDFGIAKAAQRTTQTATGNIKGKPGYMTPEGIRGQGIDQRVDIYAMGVVLHELLCMRLMRDAQSDMEVLYDVAAGRYPTFEERGVHVPRELAETVYTALAPVADQRWPDAQAFARALDDVSRKAGWHSDSGQVSQLMRQLFAQEIAVEQAAQRQDAVLLQSYAPPVPTPPEMGNASAWPGASNSAYTVVSSPGLRPVVSRSSTDLQRPGMSHSNPDLRLPGAGRTTPPRLTLAEVGATEPLLLTEQDVKRRRVLPWFLLAVVMGAGFAGGSWLAWDKLRPTPVAPALVAASLEVDSVPPGASVRLNGVALPGRTPLTAAGLAPGSVQVEVFLEGMETAREVRVLAAGEQARWAVTLQSQASLDGGVRTRDP